MKILLLSFFILLNSLLYSQGNLQFNQVLVLNPGVSYTVPPGKVVKIESIVNYNSLVTTPLSATTNAGGGSSNCIYANQVFFTLGDLNFSAQPLSNTALNGACAPTKSILFNPSVEFPIWINEGKTIELQTNITGIFVSAIEFNIIP